MWNLVKLAEKKKPTRVLPPAVLLIRIRTLSGAVIRQPLSLPFHWATTNTLELISAASHRLWRTSCVVNNPCHLESMCLPVPVSSNFRCFTANGAQVLCLTDYSLLLPARGLGNCCRWVFGPSKASVVWAFWLSGAANPKETAVTTRLLEKGNSGKVADITGGNLCPYAQACKCLYAAQTHKIQHALTQAPIRWVGRDPNISKLTK